MPIFNAVREEKPTTVNTVFTSQGIVNFSDYTFTWNSIPKIASTVLNTRLKLSEPQNKPCRKLILLVSPEIFIAILRNFYLLCDNLLFDLANFSRKTDRQRTFRGCQIVSVLKQLKNSPIVNFPKAWHFSIDINFIVNISD